MLRITMIVMTMILTRLTTNSSRFEPGKGDDYEGCILEVQASAVNGRALVDTYLI
jgi:hypothetical protein